MKMLFTLIFSFLAAAADDSLLVRAIADNVLENYKIEYVDRATKEVYPSLETINEGSDVRIGCKFMDWHYSTGILNSAMVRLSEFTADDRYAEYARMQVDYCLASYPFFAEGPAEDHRPFHFLRKFRELDHVGTECAALIRLVEKYPHLKKSYLSYIEKAAGHIRGGQSRLEDGTLVRTWPAEYTLWADDLYMGLSFMAKYGAWKKDRKMLEDAVRQVELFDSYLLNKDNGLYWHGWDQQSGEVRGAHWGRCNGWMMFAMVTLMDYIKDNKALVDRVLPIFRNHVRNICRYQDSDGMWHQLIDDPQSYKESSCTAIYVYCIAHGIVNGWLDSSYASSALKGWDAICNGQISEGYELKNVCVGTGIGTDKDFYRNRRKVDGEIHGTGLLIEAGMAIVKLRKFMDGRPSRPVLFFNHEQGEKIKETLGTTHLSQWKRVKAEADALTGTRPPKFANQKKGEQLWQRGVGNNIATLAFVGYMSEDAKYFKHAYRWAEASCSYPTWGTDKTEDGMEFGLAYGHQLLGLSMLYDYGQGYLTQEQLGKIRETLLSRTRRQYAAYTKENLQLIINHCWINFIGMLSAGMVLRDGSQEFEQWIDFVLTNLEKTSTMLIPDGVSQEGPGYWQYGIHFLMLNFDLARQLGKNLYPNSSFWKNTIHYSKFFTLPAHHCSSDENLIDWGDAKRYGWSGPSHIYHKLASLNRDSATQYFAENAVAYDAGPSWADILWYDPSVKPVKPKNYPASRHFEDMDVFASRTDWDGNETVVIYKCGAPLGKSYVPQTGSKPQNIGHTHPDAGHFVIYANGGFVLKNNGYVKRQTKYHNVALFGGKGQWGERNTWFTPWPLRKERYPFISDIKSDSQADVISSDMSAAYMDDANVKRYTRKLIWLKKEDVVVVIDDVECSEPMDVTLNFYPESQTGTCFGNVYQDRTGLHNVRIESLNTGVAMTKGRQFIENRSNRNGESTAVVTLAKNTCKETFVTAISWSLPSETPLKVSYDRANEAVTIGKHKIHIRK